MHVQRQPLGGLHHVADAVHAHDVGDFVRVADDGGRAVAHDGARELRGRDHAALQMNVRVDQTRAHEFAAHVHLAHALVFAHAGNQPVGHGDVAHAEFRGKHVQIRGVFQHQIGLHPLRGDVHQLLLLRKLSRDLLLRTLTHVAHKPRPPFKFFALYHICIAL